MLKKIALLYPTTSQFHVLHYFTEKLHDAFLRAGIQSHIYPAPTSEHLPKIVSHLIKDPPDCTLSFNGLLPDSRGQFLCDTLQIPHVACLVDSPNHFLPLLKSSHTIITCIDRSFRDFFRSKGSDRTLFLPHAIAEEIALETPQDRCYDIVMLASCIDYEAIREHWKSRHPQAFVRQLEDAAELVLSDDSTTYLDAVQRFNIPYGEDSIDILDQLEDYIRGKDRVELLRAISGYPVHLFGPKGWEKYLSSASHVILESEIPFIQALNIMRTSKIVLNSMPNYKYGAHERIFAALASGALAITNQNEFMKENFKDRKDIAFFESHKREGANRTIAHYLTCESERFDVAKRGKENVLKNHTWDQRVNFLKQSLPPLLLKMRGY